MKRSKYGTAVMFYILLESAKDNEAGMKPGKFLSTALGITDAEVSMYKRGKKALTNVDLFMRICRLTGEPPENVYTVLCGHVNKEGIWPKGLAPMYIQKLER